MDLLGAYEEEDGSDASPAAQIGGQDAAGCSQGDGGGDEHAVETEGESSLLDLLGGAGADDGGGALAAAAAGVHAGVLDRLKRADSPGTPSGEAPSDLSSPASSVPHGETGLNECCTPAAQPSGGAGADAHGWGDVDLPAAPVGSVDAVVQANVERLAAQRKQGADINTDLQDKKEFHNPGILERLVCDFKIFQSGSNYKPELFTPHFPDELHYDSLARQATRRDALHRATRTSIAFETGGLQVPDNSR